MLGYAWWKLETVSEACLSSMAEIHEGSSSVPSYPAHLMRYCNLHLYHQSSLELRILEISYLGLLLMLTEGRGGWIWLGMVFRVNGLRMETWKTGWMDCRKSGSQRVKEWVPA